VVDAPTIQIQTNSISPSNLRVPRIVSGGSLELSAVVRGRVAGSVDWFVNGQHLGKANAERWSVTMIAPTLAEAETSRRLSVEAYVLDAAGWLIDVVRQEIDVVRDATPPTVVGQPTIVASGTGTSVQVNFSEPLGGSLTSRVFRLTNAGLRMVFLERAMVFK
jgi:hypothetical protein